MKSFDYPIWLDLRDVPVLVVGAGPVAARKVEGLAAAGAVVRVVAIVGVGRARPQRGRRIARATL